MATWTDDATLIAALAAGKAYTDEKAQAQVENPVALAEGASGAPVVQQGWHPYDMLAYADGASGLIYDAAVDGAVAEVVGNDFEDGFEYAFFLDGVNIGQHSTPDTLDLALYRTTGAAYSETTMVTAVATGGDARFYGWVEVLAPRLVRNSHAVRVWGHQENSTPSNDFSIGGGATTMAGGAIIHATAQTLTRARFQRSTGNISAGKIYQFRRLRPSA